MSEREDTPKKCPVCNGNFITETLDGWVCADCGATKEKPVKRKDKGK